MPSHPLVELPSLPPSRAGGEWVGLPSKRAKWPAAWLSLLPVIPPKSPSLVNRGRRGVIRSAAHADVGSRSLNGSSPFRDVAKSSTSKPVTALAMLERWRGFCGDRSGFQVRADAPAANKTDLRLWPRSQDGGWVSGHSSCEVMICGRRFY